MVFVELIYIRCVDKNAGSAAEERAKKCRALALLSDARE